MPSEKLFIKTEKPGKPGRCPAAALPAAPAVARPDAWPDASAGARPDAWPDASAGARPAASAGVRPAGWGGCLFSCLLLFALFTGCDYHMPAIGEIQYHLNVYNDLGSQKIYQKLSVFIMGQDLDGFEDLARLYIIHDQAELLWTIDAAAWQKNKNPNHSLIGSNSLVMPDLANFPDGEYRVLLEDLAGFTTEKSFFLVTGKSKPALPDKNAFPAGYQKGQKIFLSSKEDRVTIWLYRNYSGSAANEIDTMLSALQIMHGDKGIAYQSLKVKVPALPPEFTYFLYIYEPDQNLGLISGPYYFSTYF